MAATAHADFQPIAEINTTPLVDVMLVLLIMFILVIPVTSHKVPVDLPSGPPPVAVPPPVHRLDLDQAGRLFWDGLPVDSAGLTARLAAMARDPADPVLHMNAAEETRYERFDETLAAVRRAGITRLGFVGQDRFTGALD
jgi:biopolymer transport protein ExbD